MAAQTPMVHHGLQDTSGFCIPSSTVAEVTRKTTNSLSRTVPTYASTPITIAVGLYAYRTRWWDGCSKQQWGWFPSNWVVEFLDTSSEAQQIKEVHTVR